MAATRIAVGSRDGSKSSIWKIWTQGDEIYASSRLFAGLAKVSLHSSGECRWSYTDAWVLQQSGRRNAERQIAKWIVAYPDDEKALLVLRVAIPASELRDLAAPADKKKVLWIGGVPHQATVQLLLFVTCPQITPPTACDTEDQRHLHSMQLRNGRWLVVMVHFLSLSVRDVDSIRASAVAQIRDFGVKIYPEMRIAFYAPPSQTSSAALLEVAAV